jgi:hypothetical protein
MRYHPALLLLLVLVGLGSGVQAAEDAPVEKQQALEKPVTSGQGAPSPSWPPPVWKPDADKTASRDLQDMFRYLADEALARGKPEVFAVHFRSMALVVGAYGESAPEELAALRNLYLKDWENGPTQWKAYVEGGNRRPLYLAWKSPYDGVVSVALVVLPKDWDPAKPYPLYFELHGKGKSRPLPKKTVGFVSRETGIGLASYWNQGFHVYPLNRDSAYIGVGELDLWECLEVVDRHLRTDPRRQYLFGFSLGACGTFLFGASSMEKRGWAAVAAFSPVVVHNTWVANQFRNTPVWIVYGDQEWPRRRRELEKFGLKSVREQLTALGNPPEFALIPNTGHKYVGDYQKKMLTFLSSHVNRSPVLPEWKTVRVRAFGDDTIELHVNEALVLLRPKSLIGDARVKEGPNIVAAHVSNLRWGGGMFFAAEPGDGNEWLSDGTWKFTWRKPEGNWTSEAYDDSDWVQAGTISPIEQWIGRERNVVKGLDPLLGRGVQLIGPPLTQRYRKAFESAGGDTTIQVKGVGFTHRVWLNGRLVGEGKQHAGHRARTKTQSMWPTVDYECRTQPGRNVVAIEITSVPQGGRGTLLQAAVFHPTGNGAIGRVRTGPGWRVSSSPVEGWTEAGFDDSDWFVTDATFINRAAAFWLDPAGPQLPTAYTVSPGDLYFRKVFTLAEKDSASGGAPSEKE